MTLASILRTRTVRVALACSVLLSALVLISGSESAQAAGDPNVSLSKTAPGEALAGDSAIEVTLTATNLSPTTDGYNLTFVDVLQPGVGFISSEPSPTLILTDTPHSGETTLVWRNVADLQAGVTQSLSYTISAGSLPVGTVISNYQPGHDHPAAAYVNRDPRVVPSYNTTTDNVDNGDGWDTDGAGTLLVPFLLSKNQGDTEAELLRGLHDHQTVYTLEIENNHLGASTNFAIADWLPAGIEFLGCGGVDNSSGFEPGSSGPINPGNEPALSNCIAPDLVETVEVDPPGPLPLDVYTHVVWNVGTLATSIPQSGSVTYDYIAAIPLYENVLWEDIDPPVATPPATGDQGSNVDNNRGASTEESGTEIAMTNGAWLTGTYSGTLYNDYDAMTVSAEDLSIHKSAGQDAIQHGIDTTWTLEVETSEYVGTAASLVVTDTVPDGLCPVPGCGASGSSSPAYNLATENSDGTWTLVWNLADMGASETTIITFPTVALSYYREGFADDTPVLADDSWTNNVHVAGTVDGRAVEDVSADSQSAGSVTISKQVASRLDPMNSCGDGSGLTWNDTQADGYRIGDRVCWRLAVDFPVNLDTFDSDIQDYLPPGHQYTASDSWDFGDGNTVPTGDIAGPGAGTGETVLTWSVGDGSGYVAQNLYFEVVFSSTVVDATATASGEIVENLMKYSWVNTAGTPFNLRDLADVEVLEAELDLIKGVSAVNAVSTGGNNVDGVEVTETDLITYQLTISNDGDIDANDVEVWDLLPTEYSPCGATVSSISNGGACATDTRIEWTGLSVPAGGSIAVSYDVTFPSGIAPDETIINEAGVRRYTSDANNGSGTFTYYPAGNIDPAVTTPNADVADDTSSVVTPAATITKTRTTSVDEPGNSPSNEASIGELITYTITVVIPEGTTVDNAAVVDALPPTLDVILPATVTFDGVGGSGAVGVVADLDNPGDTITVSLSDTNYTNPPGSGDDTLTVELDARVLDVPQNAHGDTIGNTAEFSWSNGGSDPDLSASVDTGVVEPRIGVTKTSVDSIGGDGVVVGGETVDYTITVSNAAGRATAHDLVVIDTVPEGLTPAAPIPAGWIADGTPGNGIAGTITWNIASVAPGAATQFTYAVSVDNPIVVSTDLTNTVVVTSSTMAGTPTGERHYSVSDSDTQGSPLVSIGKAVAPSAATVGGVVTYTVDVSIPPGTIMYDATVIDTLPVGLAYDGMVSSTCDMNGSACDPMISVTDVGVVGSQAVGFWLGDLVPASATGEERVVAITYEAHVLPILGRGDTPDNSATVWGNQTDKILVDPAVPPSTAGFDVSAGPATASFVVREPVLAIDKDVAGQVADSDRRRALPGETLTYTVRVSNSGLSNLWPAHDMTIVDSLTDLSYISVNSITGGGVWDAGADTITWTVPGPLAPNDSLTFTYDVVLDTPLGVGVENPGAAELINTADVPSYFGVAEAERAAAPLGVTFVEYNNVDDDQVDVELDVASIGDYVWFDSDGDGNQDAGELPLTGIDVTVTYHGVDGVFGTGDDETHITTTNALGAYLVDELPGGPYTVVVDSADIPPGMTPSYNLDGTLDHTWTGALAENADKDDVDFGYTGNGTIGDTIWFDIDRDGTIDGDEHGLEGVDVDVTWYGFDGVAGGSDDVVYRATTDANGNYSVDDLPAGNYVVVVDTVTLPAGMTPSFDADGGFDGSSALTLGASEVNNLQDFGYAGTGTIGDYVWLDINGDALQAPAEPALVGIPIRLTWPGEDGVLGGGDDEMFLLNTDGSGEYLFMNLPPGEYRIEVLGGLPAVATNTFDEDGGNDSTAVVDLGNGDEHRTTDFGYQGSSSIGDAVWWNIDGDGVVGPGEPGIEGVEITLLYAGVDGAIGNADDLTFTTTTDANGNYLFSDLPAGNYRVTVTDGVPAGFIANHDENGGNDETTLVALGLLDVHVTADFGYEGTGSIGDFVFLDTDGNGFDDVGEPGIPDVDVELTWYGVDGIGGTSDDVLLTTTTDAVGDYLFPGLPTGGYDVAVQPGTLPIGVTPTGDADGVGTPHVSSLTLAVGDNDIDQDFGYRGGGAIGDTVWFDRNGDGVLDGDEYGIGGVGMTVTWAGPDGTLGNGDDESFTTTTDVSGSYLIGNLPPGEYQVQVDAATLPPGMTASYDEDGTADGRTIFTLALDEQHFTADFGYVGAGEIGDLIWLDADANGAADSGEPGIPAQTVQLIWAGPDATLGSGDDQVYTTTTDATGNYVFDGLPPGDYDIEVVGPIAAAAVNTSDEDADDDSHTTVALSDGASHLSADFGYSGTAEIGDLVWHDFNGDGVAAAGEPGLENVTVVVTWYGADGVAGGGDDITLPDCITDATGQYLATGLPDGEYGVAVIAGVPAGLANTSDEDGDLDEQTDVSGLFGGSSHLTADFGYTGSGRIGDIVWWDSDGDGSQGAAEPGFYGVDVALTWAGRNGTFGDGDDAVFTTTTDGDGNYLFDRLPPGEFTVAVDETGLPPGVVQSGDPDAILDGQSSVTLTIGEGNLDQDFGYRGEGSVGDFVWYDLNNDAVADPDEPGLVGVTVTVTFFGPDGVAGGADDVSFAAATDETGLYTVPGLPSGFYRAEVDPTTVPTGLVFTADLDGGDPEITLFSLGAAEDRTDIDYPVVGEASLSGTVWNDADGDQVIDADEVGVSDVTIIVTWDGPVGPVVIPVVSDADGAWLLPLLPPGDYTVELDVSTVPDGMSPTTPIDAAVTLPGDGHEVIDFGLAEHVTLGSAVWIDTDDDGVVDPEEEGIPGVLVNLYDLDGVLVDIAETDADGTYLFIDLLPGTYLVQLVPDSLPEELRATYDRDGSPDLNTIVALADGVSILDANFGFQVSDDLPNTGFEMQFFLLAGLLLTLLGMVLVVATGIRRSGGRAAS